MKTEKAILIEKKDPDYAGLLWTIKAISKYESAHMLNRLSIVDKDAVCTDGHRLHNYFLQDTFEPGLYESFCVNNKIILIQSQGQYPDWKPLFLEEEATKVIKIPCTNDPQNINTSYAKLIRLMAGDEGLNLGYWKDMLSFGGEYQVQWYGSGKQMIFINSTHRAVVMPMRV